MESNPEPGGDGVPLKYNSLYLLIGIFKPVDDPITLVFLFIGLLILLCLSALVSGSEVAFFSINGEQLDKLNEDNSSWSNRITNLLKKPRKLLATILIANNLFNVGIVILSYFLIGKLIDFNSIALRLNEFTGFQIGPSFPEILFNVLVVTGFLVLFGEVIPKVSANRNNMAFSKTASGPLSFISRILKGPAYLLTSSTKSIESKLSGRSGQELDLEEIDQAIELAVTNQDEDEINILKGIIKFGNIPVKQAMTSRMDMISIPESANYKELYNIVLESGYSRIPVHGEDLDDIKGFIYAKDILAHMDEAKNFKWHKLIREALFVPENKKIDDLLREFQTKRIHVAIVIDEYGGTNGLITLEDIVEEVIGDIQDEFDEEELSDFKKLEEDHYELLAKTPINDFCKAVDIPLNEFDDIRGDADSVAGLLLELSGRIPKQDELIDFENYQFKIVSVDENKIENIRVKILPKDELSKPNR